GGGVGWTGVAGKDGRGPRPFRSRWGARGGDGWGGAGFGPAWPVEPGSASVWQPVHPAVRKTFRPCATLAWVGAASLSGLIAIASPTTATAPTAGIHQCVRPAWRRLKKTRTPAPRIIRATRTSQA